ncbi:hypothetical protein C8T65DRAFT_645220 [Cerioporus squamosus]|nr:hypothetical protein C8T65DRAFT_645220 [Cerioporus squamosus]
MVEFLHGLRARGHHVSAGIMLSGDNQRSLADGLRRACRWTTRALAFGSGEAGSDVGDEGGPGRRWSGREFLCLAWGGAESVRFRTW